MNILTKPKKYILLAWVLLMSAINLIAQQDSFRKQHVQPNDFLELIQDNDVTFAEVQEAFYTYWRGRTDYKGNGWKVFKRWEYINESRVLPNGRLQSPGYIKEIYDQYMSQYDGISSAGGNWSFVAPNSYPINNTSQPTGMGRVNAIAFHPTDANTIYLGAASGGFWKSTSGGNTWTNLSNNLPTLGVSSILIHPSNPNIIYIGTGDRDADDAEPMGVYYSTDGGSTWNQRNFGMGNVTVGAMVMHPTDANTILAATSTGIYKTTDGGAIWHQKTSGNFKDLKLKPGDPNTVYAVKILTPSEFYRSTNNGDTWTKITSGIPTSGIGSRMVIGVSPANANIVYLVQILSSNKNFAGLLRSTDSGLSFSTQSTSPNIFDYACDGSGTSSQATYDLCIAVDPTNANTLYVGSINNWKSNDGGVTWSIVSHWSNDCSIGISELHADQHVYEWSPLNEQLYIGHDGGISYTNNGGGSWTEITGNLGITQIYRIGQSSTESNHILLGMQDNGSAASIGSVFTTTRGGDGTECIIDYSNTNYCYNTYVEGDISRSTTGATGSYSNIASTGTNGIGADETGAWVTPYLLHKTNASTMFAGYENVFRTTNVKASPASSVSWTAISSGETSTCKILEQSLANVDIMYVVRLGSMKRTENANASAASVLWTACTLPGGSTPEDVKADPTDENIVFAVNDYKVYKSTDKGDTWTDISSNLPALFINCMVIDNNDNEGLYIGNQTSVWYKNANMSNWILFSHGLPPVDIRELEIFYDPIGSAHLLKAATYGRGLWESSLAEINSIDPSDFSALASSSSQIDLTWTKNALDENVIIAASTTNTFGVPVDGTAYTAGNNLAGGGNVIYVGNNSNFAHSGLNASTTYYYKIWSVNSTNQYSAGLPTINEKTDCSAISSLPYTETFDDPSCWKTKDNTGQGNWQYGTTFNVNYPTINLTEPYAYFSAEYGVSHSYSADLISPMFDLSSYQSIQLKFKHLFDRSIAYPSYGKVYYSIDNGQNWVELASYSSSDSPNPEIVSLCVSPAAGETEVKFKWSYTSSPTGAYLWAVDDVTVSICNDGIWTGTTNTDWHTTSNWCNNTLPTSTTDVIIPGGITNMPYITSPTIANCNDMTLETSSTLKMASGTELDITGNWTNNGNLDYANSSSSSLVKFNGTVAQTYSGNTVLTLRKLEIDNSLGITIGSELRADNITLKNGLVTTSGAAKLNLFGGTLTRTNGYVNGTLQKYTFTNPSAIKTVTFEIGDASNYTPVTLTFPIGSITAAGGFAMKTTASDHANINTSVLNGSKSVNRYWSFPLVGITFSSCGAVFNFTTNDLDVGCNTNNLEAGKYASTTWAYPSVGTKTASSVQLTNLASSSLGDIQFAENKYKASIISGGSWEDANTWSPSGSPDASNHVTITSPGTVTVNLVDAQCNDLLIQSNSVLQINPNNSLTVNGTLTNSAGTSGLIIKSDATGTGSLIHSTSNIQATFERYMNNADWTDWNDGWHFVSSPIIDQAISPAFASGNYDFYSWYEPENLWVNFKNTTVEPTWNTVNGSTDFVLGKGYMTGFDDGGTKCFTGALNVDNVTQSNLSITNGNTNKSWHLLGNPFASALSWDASSAWSLENIAGVAKIWNEAYQSYSDVTSSPASIIPATNGFMVQVSSGVGNLQIPAAKRTHSTTPFFKSTLSSIKLKAVNTTANNAQECIITLNPSANQGFDLLYDGEFLAGYGPRFYSIIDNLKLSTNSLPLITNETEILLGFEANSGSNFQIEYILTENSIDNVLLYDKKTNKTLDLSQNPVYKFIADVNDDPQRFILKFGSLGIEYTEANPINVAYHSGQLHFYNLNDIAHIELYAINGQKLIDVTQNEPTHRISLSAGVYIVKLSTAKQTLSQKIIVK